MKGICKNCGKFTKYQQEHHTYPRWLSGLNDAEAEEKILVCPSCHSTMDKWFETFILTGGKGRERWNNPKRQKEWNKTNREMFTTFYFTPEKNFGVREDITSFGSGSVRYSIRWIYRKKGVQKSIGVCYVPL